MVHILCGQLFILLLPAGMLHKTAQESLGPQHCRQPRKLEMGCVSGEEGEDDKVSKAR